MFFPEVSLAARLPGNFSDRLSQSLLSSPLSAPIFSVRHFGTRWLINVYLLFLNNLLLFYAYGCFVYVCLSTTCVPSAHNVQRMLEPLELEFLGDGSSPSGFWEYNLDPLEEHPVCVTTEPFLQLQRVPSRLSVSPLGMRG